MTQHILWAEVRGEVLSLVYLMQKVTNFLKQDKNNHLNS